MSLAPHAGRFGLRREDGLALLRWLLDLVGDEETEKWLQVARNSVLFDSDPTRPHSAARPGLPA